MMVSLKGSKYLWAYVGPATAYLAVALGGIWSYSAVFLVFLIIPLAEVFVPSSGGNIPHMEIEQRSGARFFDWLLYVNIPILYGLIVLFLHRCTYSTLDSWEVVGMTLGVGIFVGASGINVAHELGHRSKKLEQFMSKVLLIPGLYLHFFIEHNRGHHRYVATPLDPATARYGEWLYSFWVRSAIKGYLSAWKIEKKLLHSQGMAMFSIQNSMLRFMLIQLFYLASIYFFFGSYGMILAIFIGVIGFLLLETINYIEHYGLLRKQVKPGSFERVRHIHSWSSNHELGRIMLYELTRHPDHHYKASKKYQVLDHISEGPQLPFGYPGSIILSLIPPLWFYIMNKRVPGEMVPQK